MTTPAILAYVRSGGVFTGANDSLVGDFTNNLAYVSFQGATNPLDGFTKFNGYSDDSPLLERTVSTFPPVSDIESAFGVLVFSYGGYLVFQSNPKAGVTNLNVVRASDFSFVATASIPQNLYSLAPLRSNSSDYVIGCSQIALQTHSTVYYGTLPGLPTYATLFLVDEHDAVCCRGAIGSTGTAFVLGRPSATTGAFGLYKITSASGAAPSFAKVGTFSPTNIDATWTHVTSSCGISYDQTDGNILLMASTTDSVTNKSYIVKVSASTAAVLWAVPVASIDIAGDFYMGRANITASTLYYLTGNTLYTVNTSAGTATSATIGTLSEVGGQISDDASTSLLVRGTWSETTTHPTYLGAYMGTGGNHTISSQTWLRFFPGGVPPAPPPPPPPPPPFPIVSVSRAWTYTMDGHTFYVLDLGAEGTFVYDLDTQQWSNFQTNGANWSMVNGCMFGQRVVAGDLATTDVWELVPSAVFDSGSFAYEITHVATGGIVARTRQYISCAALRVSASFGQLDDVAGVNISLSYSDDQGQTWQTPAPIALTEGSYSQEIVWRSLGSFAAPGRVFQLTDAGGVIRIDGVDAMLDDFDDEKQPSEQG